MNSPAFGGSPFSGIPALVVEPELAHRELLVSTLTWAGFDVNATDSFSRAQALLVTEPPSVLVTEIRLEIYNGLHLVLLGRSRRPQMTVVVTSRFLAPDLQRGAEALGATFVRKPTTPWKLLATLARLPLGARHGERHYMTAAIRDEEERRYRKRRRDIATFLLLEASRR